MMSEIEDMFLAFKEEYLRAMQSKAIADRDAAEETHRVHLEMHEMDAWDEFALAALRSLGGSTNVSTATAEQCATFANALLEERRKTFG